MAANSLGRQPKETCQSDHSSREAAAEAGVSTPAVASRLKGIPVVANLGLTPKAIRWRCFAAPSS